MEGKGSYPGPLPAVVTAMVREGDRAASTLARGKKTSRGSAHGHRRTRSGHQREAAQRRRAHPKGSAHTGEGARGGAGLSFLRPPWTADAGAQSLGAAWREKGRESNEARVLGG